MVSKKSKLEIASEQMANDLWESLSTAEMIEMLADDSIKGILAEDGSPFLFGWFEDGFGCGIVQGEPVHTSDMSREKWESFKAEMQKLMEEPDGDEAENR
jgi:hypothetical protein